MNTPRFAIAAAALLIGTDAIAAPPAALIDGYAEAARAADVRFAGFSAARGEALHRTRFAGGKPDTPSCTACHGEDARTAGKTRAGKPIEPMAASVVPERYADAAKVEKWFRRNCNEVLGRDCSPLEKGDWLTYMRQQ